MTGVGCRCTHFALGQLGLEERRDTGPSAAEAKRLDQPAGHPQRERQPPADIDDFCGLRRGAQPSWQVGGVHHYPDGLG
eukprot:SAG22_NODE_12547_length_438_cov_1.064897_1_plen_78_part_01